MLANDGGNGAVAKKLLFQNLRHRWLPFTDLFVGVFTYRTMRTSPSNLHLVSSASMIDCTFAGIPPPDPAPLNGRASDL
jgi:hypothetical protein